MFKKIFLILVVLAITATARIRTKHRVATHEPRAELEAISAALSSAPALKYEAIRKIFNDNVIRIAREQGKPARREIGTYEDVGVRQNVKNGNAEPWVADYTYKFGGSGGVYAIYNHPTNGKPESIDIEFSFRWPSCTGPGHCKRHLLCQNVGKADTTPCDFSAYMDAERPAVFGSNPDPFYATPDLGSKDMDKFKQNSIRVTAKGVLVVREYYEVRGQTMPHTIRHIRGTFSPDAFIPTTYGDDGDYVKTLKPDVAQVVAAVQKSKILTTEQIIRKFFTQENIDLALMQGARVPVKRVISAYQTANFAKDCEAGVCTKWSEINLNTPDQFGGEGSITLTCTIIDPKDLSKSKCGVTMIMKGGYGWEHQTFADCPAVGNAVSKCNGIQSGPSYFKLKDDTATGRKFWDRVYFGDSSNLYADEFYFTDVQMVARWKWHTIRKYPDNGMLRYSDLVAFSAPFADYSNSDKANCLSKATADQVLKIAAEKKNLKNKIILQRKPVEDLIKSAPYKSVDDAITKISGIGPVNVVYVSFWYNFFC